MHTGSAVEEANFAPAYSRSHGLGVEEDSVFED